MKAHNKRLQRIQLLMRLAEKEEQKALTQLVAMKEQWQNEQQRLADIDRYYSEYRSQYEVSQQSTHMAAFTQLRQCLLNLDQTRELQTLQIQRAFDNYQQADADWRQRHLKTQALQDYKQRSEQQFTLEQNKREQQHQDELNTLRRP